MSDNYDISETPCPNCKHGHTHRSECGCEDGYSHHNCGEDCCMCLYPDPNIVCDDCQGRGGHNWCPNCGWDLLQKRFINGKDARKETCS